MICERCKKNQATMRLTRTVNNKKTVMLTGDDEESAQKIAKEEYDKFKIIQDRDYQSDFDKLIIDIKRIEGVN